MRTRVEIEGLNGFLRDMNRADRALTKEVRLASKGIAYWVAEGARRRARRGPPQLAAIAETIKPVSDRIPSVRAAGAKRVTSRRIPAHLIYFGADFGAHRRNWPQFPHTPPVEGGRTIYPEYWSRKDQVADDYLDAVQRVFMGRRGNPAAMAVDQLQRRS